MPRRNATLLPWFVHPEDRNRVVRVTLLFRRDFFHRSMKLAMDPMIGAVRPQSTRDRFIHPKGIFMRKFLIAAAATVAFAAPAIAQDSPRDAAPGEAAAPDGSKAFGIEPYVGVMAGYEWFDSESNKAGIPLQSNKLEGTLIQAVAGVNVPLGAFFVGAEGNVAKGLSSDIEWQYGAAGRFGVRAGDSGMFYGKVGYQWVEFDRTGISKKDYNDVTYGIGFEAGPKDIGLGGITGNAGVRLRGEVSTFGNFHSFRPMLGVVTHF